ncbi:MAG: hypothetical protein HOP28_15865 [Gemmatimonadales bacterium]|nr:hypothetical protein [Gemmatimonadales bacterium]
MPSAEDQIGAAVFPLPASQRAGAAVLGYGKDGKLVPLRVGTNDMICLASPPAEKDLHVSCYHGSMEPFMARGRSLRAAGITVLAKVDSVRFKEVKEGTIKMPQGPAMLYQLFGGSYDPVKKEIVGARALYVAYIPGATAASTGLPDRPVGSAPWIMFPGTPKAHIMFTPTM